MIVSPFKPRFLAEKIMKEHSLLSDPETGLMYRWNGKYWERYDEDQIRKFALQELGSESQKSRAEDAVYQVKMLATIPHGRKINDHDYLVCLQNGMFSLTDFQNAARSKIPLHLFPARVFSIRNQSAPVKDGCVIWTKRPDPESIAQVAGVLWVTSGQQPKYEKCLLLIAWMDGKKHVTEDHAELIGSENCAAISFQDFGDQFHGKPLQQDAQA